MKASIVECPNCHFRFNYLFNGALSLHASMLKGARYFECPNCRVRQKFDLTVLSVDRTLPIYDDRIQFADIIVLVVPLIPLFAFLVVCTALLSGNARIAGIVLSVIGVFLWPFIFTTYSISRVPVRKIDST